MTSALLQPQSATFSFCCCFVVWSLDVTHVFFNTYRRPRHRRTSLTFTFGRQSVNIEDVILLTGKWHFTGFYSDVSNVINSPDSAKLTLTALILRKNMTSQTINAYSSSSSPSLFRAANRPCTDMLHRLPAGTSWADESEKVRSETDTRWGVVHNTFINFQGLGKVSYYKKDLSNT